MSNPIEQFYLAFKQLDAEGMVKLYHPSIEFKDPAFGVLKGEKAKDMWRMLCANAQDFKLDFSQVEYDGETGKAHWDAYYTFSQTGRKVHNSIDATFKFKDGFIIQHHDHFNLHKWARQALGFKGMLLGGTNFFQKKLQEKTNKALAKYQAAEQKKRP